ncbi:DNA-binding transcriptional regulator, MarR family [Natronincola peptidivorans]|uniref:HTH-type transcriptional regulator SarZ n=1 Tax=Natronincola peptidivorans TaxID=426128 RepID=A0A1H9ZYF2_9FIRM|nr:MarR family transcriptional regulator [Natronincola peptidivorans]SES86800.1 DNA-binding transcriptional regulator, MarR family [Natronincola peptidivorans]
MRNYYLQINEYVEKLVENIIIHDKKGLVVKGTSLSVIELLILKKLGNVQEKKMYEMIEALNIDRNSFVTYINKLQQKQYIMKRKSRKDKRVQVLSLTEKGKELTAEIVKKEKEMLYSILNDFSFNEEKAILKFLVKLDMLNKEKNRN